MVAVMRLQYDAVRRGGSSTPEAREVTMDDEARAIVGNALERARRLAGPAMKENFVHDDWVMSVDEFEAYWVAHPLAAFCTVSPFGAPHVVPIEPSFVAGRFVMETFANAVRIADLRVNARASLISWSSPWEVVIVQGRASLSEAAETSTMVSVTLIPRRIYAIRPPAGHHAAQASSQHGDAPS
jgi:hypothetical protein